LIKIYSLFIEMMCVLNGVVVIKQRQIHAILDNENDINPVESQRNPLGRRLLVLHLAAAPVLLGGARGSAAEPLQKAPVIPVVTDADPGDGQGNGRGTQRKAMTDSDPRDEAGRGRRGT
jgi:hypothetical protein